MSAIQLSPLLRWLFRYNALHMITHRYVCSSETAGHVYWHTDLLCTNCAKYPLTLVHIYMNMYILRDLHHRSDRHCHHVDSVDSLPFAYAHWHQDASQGSDRTR